MAQYRRTIFDTGRGLAIPDPREDEARAKEASARAENDLRSTIAARLVAQQQGAAGLNLQARGLDQQAAQARSQDGLQRSQMGQQQRQFDSSQEFSGRENAMQRAFQQAMQDAGFGFQQGENALNRNMQGDQFDRTFGRQGEQFDKTFGLQERGFNQAAEQFGKTFGLQERGFNQAAEQFGKTFGLQQQQFNQGREDTILDRALRNEYRTQDINREGRYREDDQAHELEKLRMQMGGSRTGYEAVQNNRMAASSTLEPFMDSLLSGKPLSQENVAQIRMAVNLNPEIGPEIERVLRSRAMLDSINKADDERYGSVFGPVDAIMGLPQALGLTDDPRKAALNRLYQAAGSPGSGTIEDFFRQNAPQDQFQNEILRRIGY